MTEAGARGARVAHSGSVRTDPEKARWVIADSRRVFDERYPELKLAPVVGLICAYEEEANIGAVLAAMPAEACGLPLSTLVVVDGGDDRTDRVALDAGAITFVLHENLGQGYALRVGYSLAIELGAAFVVTLDADGQNDPAEIEVILQPLVDDAADFVVASRRLGHDATSDRLRKAGVHVFSRVISLLGGTKLTDSSNGYRAVTRPHARRRHPSADAIAVPDGRIAHHLYEAGLAYYGAPLPVAAPGFGEFEEGKQLPLRAAVRPRRALDLVA